MSLTVLTQPQQTAFTTLTRLRARLGIETSETDSLYTALIPEATGHIQALLGFHGIRRQVRDRFRGHGFDRQGLHDAPLASLGTIQLDGSDVDQTNQLVSVESTDAALIHRSAGWTRTDRALWTIDYWAGWLVPSDDFVSAAVTFTDSGQTLTLSSGSWPLLVAGDRITLAGATDADNSGTFTVSERTSDTVLALDAGSGIDDEAEGDSITITVRNLPEVVERATIITARDMAISRTGTSGEIVSEKAGPIETQYGSRTSEKRGAVSGEVLSLLRQYRRLL